MLKDQVRAIQLGYRPCCLLEGKALMEVRSKGPDSCSLPSPLEFFRVQGKSEWEKDDWFAVHPQLFLEYVKTTPPHLLCLIDMSPQLSLPQVSPLNSPAHKRLEETVAMAVHHITTFHDQFVPSDLLDSAFMGYVLGYPILLYSSSSSSSSSTMGNDMELFTLMDHSREVLAFSVPRCCLHDELVVASLHQAKMKWQALGLTVHQKSLDFQGVVSM